MERKKRVIIVTDGDVYARKAVESVAKQMGGRCISASSGNPSRITARELIPMILSAPSEPVLVMFDDSGFIGEGPGESIMKEIVSNKHIEVIGAIAVAAKSRKEEWTHVDVCIDRDGELTAYGVDKFGVPELDIGIMNGDTVYSLDSLDIPFIVGIGDIGKISLRDRAEKGAPLTKKAVELIMERSGMIDGRDEGETTYS